MRSAGIKQVLTAPTENREPRVILLLIMEGARGWS
jgi:hypothetical protein